MKKYLKNTIIFNNIRDYTLKFFIHFICFFSSKRKRKKIQEKYHFNHNVIIVENGKERPEKIGELKNLHISSVLDAKSRQVLNRTQNPIIIGNHVWIGESVHITKNAQIPDDCIVGIASVVTKKFTQKHCLLAGNPAEIKKTNISWDRLSPWRYKQQEEK